MGDLAWRVVLGTALAVAAAVVLVRVLATGFGATFEAAFATGLRPLVLALALERAGVRNAKD